MAGSRAVGLDVAFVILHFGKPAAGSWNIFRVAIVIPNGAEREGFSFFHQGQTGSVITVEFTGLELGDGSNEGEQKRFEQVARADDPGGDAVDAGVKIIKT